jgi:[ribosomal protein S5]-alanine N-acetyltransferase
MKILTNRLILREINEKDIPYLLKDMNKLEIAGYLEGVPLPYTELDAKEWIDYCKKESKRLFKRNYIFGLELKDEKGLIGEIGLTQSILQMMTGTREFMYWLNEDHQGIGLMTEALNKVIDYSFTSLRTNKLALSAITNNTQSQKLASRLGFKRKYIRKQSSKIESTGKVHDDIVYILTKKEWYGLKK